MDMNRQKMVEPHRKFGLYGIIIKCIRNLKSMQMMDRFNATLHKNSQMSPKGAVEKSQIL